jgi:hypothetical protein
MRHTYFRLLYTKLLCIHYNNNKYLNRVVLLTDRPFQPLQGFTAVSLLWSVTVVLPVAAATTAGATTAGTGTGTGTGIDISSVLLPPPKYAGRIVRTSPAVASASARLFQRCPEWPFTCSKRMHRGCPCPCPCPPKPRRAVRAARYVARTRLISAVFFLPLYSPVTLLAAYSES